MKCIPRDTFIPEELLDFLMCPIGFGILNEPVALPCQHVFCKKCLEATSASGGKCPTCEKEWQKEDLVHQVEVAEMVNNLSAKCPQCEWTGLFQSLENHLKTSCLKALAQCPHGCGNILPRSYLKVHEEECKFRKIDCPTCKNKFLLKDFKDHDIICPEKVIPCPQRCGKSIKFQEIALHIRECPNPRTICMFAFAGCCYIIGQDESLDTHYKLNIERHLDLLSNTVVYLQEKFTKLQQEERKIPSGLQTSNANNGYQVIKWSNGSTILTGSKKNGWSFFLTDKTIEGNFAARVQIQKLGMDQNTWKMCLGIFNSPKFQAGSWEKYKNGWGYVLGNGYKVHEGGPVSYGENYGVSDIITIEMNRGKITFYKNGKSQGEAFNGAVGPFYLAVALSDIGHSIELLDVKPLTN